MAADWQQDPFIQHLVDGGFDPVEIGYVASLRSTSQEGSVVAGKRGRPEGYVPSAESRAKASAAWQRKRDGIAFIAQCITDNALRAQFIDRLNNEDTEVVAAMVAAVRSSGKASAPLTDSEYEAGRQVLLSLAKEVSR